MTTFNDLCNAIDNLLNLSSGQLQLRSNTCERAYEVYILSLCVEAVRRAGGNPIPVGRQSGAFPSILVFRGAPGSMSSRAQDFCYIRCSLNGQQFEIHVDVEYEGVSGATHEIDVSICKQEHCEQVRSNSNFFPKTNQNLLMLFECKFYGNGNNNSPRVALARTFVGLLNDCSQTKLLSGFVSNIGTPGLRSYLSKKNRPQPFNPLPSDADSEERFIRNVEQELRRWAKV